MFSPALAYPTIKHRTKRHYAWLREREPCHTYTYGPLGVIMRTAEMGDPDPTNNRHHYYLPDAMGGNVGMYVDDDGDQATDRVAVFNQFDAFGNRMTETSPTVGTRGWRGQEGSITDRDSGLVYMQSRHYDPAIGRFIQADSLSLGSFTTQGMNRYIYVSNDPVNMTDPSGYIGFLAITVFLLGAVLGSLLASWVMGGMSNVGRLAKWEMRGLILAAAASFGFGCHVQFLISDLVLGAAAAGGSYAAALMSVGLRLLGAAFLAGFMLGFYSTALIIGLVSSKKRDDWLPKEHEHEWMVRRPCSLNSRLKLV